MTNVLIIGAGGQIPAILIPRLQAEPTLKLTLFGSDAANYLMTMSLRSLAMRVNSTI